MPSRPYERGRDDEAVLSLRARTWGSDHPHTSAAFHRWLFDRTPDGPGGGVVYERNGAVVAFAGFANRPGRRGDERVALAHGLDFMADPDLGGVMSGRAALATLRAHLAEIAARGFDGAFNFPNENSARMLASDKVGYAEALTPALHVLPLPHFRRAGSAPWLRAAEMTAGRAAGAFARARASIGPRAGAAEIARVERYDDGFDRLWEALCADGRFRLARDAKNLSWRFVEHPVHSYTRLAAREGGETIGHLATSPRFLFDMDARLVCDLSVAPGRPDVAAALLRRCVSDAIAERAGVIAAYASPGGPEAKALRAAGFLRAPTRFNPRPCMLLLRLFAPEADPAEFGARWAFSWGDTDVA